MFGDDFLTAAAVLTEILKVLREAVRLAREVRRLLVAAARPRYPVGMDKLTPEQAATIGRAIGPPAATSAGCPPG
jgi:hypothetical protein